MIHRVVYVLALALIACTSEAEKESASLYHEATDASARGEHELVVEKITKALAVVDGGKDTWSTGTILLVRGKSYEALGRNAEAIADYQEAIAWGTEYLSSYVLNSDPSPGAKQDWLRTLSGFHASLARALARDGRCTQAAEQLQNAIRSAGASRGIDLTDKVVAEVFGRESTKREEFAATVGTYFFSLGVVEKKLGRTSDANDIAYRLGFNPADALSDEISCQSDE